MCMSHESVTLPVVQERYVLCARGAVTHTELDQSLRQYQLIAASWLSSLADPGADQPGHAPLHCIFMSVIFSVPGVTPVPLTITIVWRRVIWQ